MKSLRVVLVLLLSLVLSVPVFAKGSHGRSSLFPNSLMLVPGSYQYDPNITPGGVSQILRLSPLTDALNSILDKAKHAIALHGESGTSSQQIRTLYGQLLDLQNARELYLQSLNKYIGAKQSNSSDDELKALGYKLLQADEAAQRSFVRVLDTLKELQVQLDIDSPTSYDQVSRYLHANSENLFVSSFFSLGIAPLKTLSDDITKNSELLKNAINELRSFIKQKYPSATK